MPSPNQTRWEPIAREAARAAGIDECIFVSLINQESTWDPGAQNGNCYGIAQINPTYHAVDPYDATAALFYAAKLIKSYKDEGGSYEQALGAYNWGAGNMRGNGWVVPSHIQSNFVGPILTAASRCVVPTPMTTPEPTPSYMTTLIPATNTPVPAHISTPTPAPGMTVTPTPQIGLLGLVLILVAVTRK